jgi:drug/metabolite transporter (DMT)-like permease
MKERHVFFPYLLLVSCALGWALSTIIIKASIGEVPAFHLMAGRFLFASGLLFLMKPSVLKTIDRESIKSSFVLAIFLFLAYTFSIVSLIYTTASKSGFLVALSVLFVPIVQSIIKRKLPTLWLVITIALSVFGMWLISGMDGGGFNIGDLYAILCSAAYTGYIMAMHKFTHDHPTHTLTILQLMWVTVFSFIALFIFEDFTPSIFITGAVPILTVGLVGTALTTLTQTYAQQKVSPEAVGIILLGEPLFTLLMAVVLLSEGTTLKGLVGAVLLLMAMLMAIVKKL